MFIQLGLYEKFDGWQIYQWMAETLFFSILSTLNRYFWAEMHWFGWEKKIVNEIFHFVQVSLKLCEFFVAQILNEHYQILSNYNQVTAFKLISFNLPTFFTYRVQRTKSKIVYDCYECFDQSNCSIQSHNTKFKMINMYAHRKLWICCLKIQCNINSNNGVTLTNKRLNCMSTFVIYEFSIFTLNSDGISFIHE